MWKCHSGCNSPSVGDWWIPDEYGKDVSNRLSYLVVNCFKITDFTEDEVSDFALTLKQLTTKYDNVFETSFPYSSGIHQSPTDGELHPEWHFHMHFYPPLLRSATVKKFMVGYEMMGESQRDITPEKSAQMLRELSDVHYKISKK